MAVMIPPVLPATAPPGEREVFRRLSDDPDARDWLALHSLDIPNHVSQVSGEADFVIIVPGAGVVVIEVKSHASVRRDPQGIWYYGKDVNGEARGPFRQAADAMHSIRRKLIKSRPDLSRVVFWSGVVIPRASVRLDPGGEWHPWQLIDAAKFRGAPFSALILSLLHNAREHLLSCSMPWFVEQSQEPYPEQCRAIAAVLRPAFEAHQSPAARGRELLEELRVYTDEQLDILDQLDANQRLLVKGPAGSGKTILAIETARRASESDRKVALLCFNRLLGAQLAGLVQGTKQLHSSTIHALMLEVAGIAPPAGAQDDSDFWSAQLPQAAADSLLQREDDRWLFDELVLDEFQDLQQQPILDFLDLLLKGGLAAGRWRAFGDFARQSIYVTSNGGDVESRLGNPATCRLTANCRNTPRVAEYVRQLGRLDPFYKRILRPDDGVDPELRSYKDAGHQVEILTKTIQDFRGEGYKTRDIVVLSTKKRGAPAELAANADAPVKLELYPASDSAACNWTTVHAFKGLEAPVVIIADMDHVTTAERADLFYIGITRALQRLVILLGPSARRELAELLT
jgi:hypothetical protein